MSKYNKIKKKHPNDKYIVAGVVAVLILMGVISIWISSVQPRANNNATSTDPIISTTTVPSTSTTTNNGTPVIGDQKIISLAKCLAQKRVTMYGAEWCSHCQDQKDAFGSAWAYVPYVECPDNTTLCISKKIESYPTWLKTDGTKLEGFIVLADLAQWAGCSF